MLGKGFETSAKRLAAFFQSSLIVWGYLTCFSVVLALFGLVPYYVVMAFLTIVALGVCLVSHFGTARIPRDVFERQIMEEAQWAGSDDAQHYREGL